MLEQAHAESEGPSIEDADVIVAGGRGLGSPENFSLVEALAKALGGAVAATRAVVDAGWYPYATQVGQTGKTVSPKLYIACGISGAIQHKVGMQGSGVVIAINKDPNAPIFEFADLGVVGDLNEVVPKLTELVEQRKIDDVRPRTTRRRSRRGRVHRRADRPADERIEVGVLIVGAGPAGSPARSASASSLEEQPELAERLGDVPVAVLEKGKQPGSHISVGRGRQSARPAPALPRLRGHRGHAVLRRGRGRGRLLHEARVGDPDPDSADDEEPRQLRRVALAAHALARRAGRGGRRDDPPGDRGREAPRRRRARARRPHRRQGPWPRRRAAGQLRAGLGHLRARDHPLRGDAGPL